MRASARPRADEMMTLTDGRTLAYCEWGDPTGHPVVLMHGAPGSRLLCPDEEATAASGVRLLTADRPGYGGSDPRPDPTLLGWVAMRLPVRPGCPSGSAWLVWPVVWVPMMRCRGPWRRT